MVAYDSANPDQKAVAAEVTISVSRNENAPIFAQTIYTVDNAETEWINWQLGQVIQQVTATDEDGVSSFDKLGRIVYYLGQVTGVDEDGVSITRSGYR